MSRVRIILTTAAIGAAVALVAGSCANPATTLSNGKLRVVASFYPLYEAAVKVGGPYVTVTNLTPAGADPHDLELSPPEVNDILSANVMLYEGSGFQPAVEAAVKQRRGGTTVNVLDGLGTLMLAPPGEGTAGTVDPHVWLDPVRYRTIVAEVARAFGRADPAHRGAFDKNAGAFEAQISAVDARYRAGLATCARRTIVTAHAAWQYLSARYHLTQDPITGISPESEPNPQRLAQLAALVKREGITTIFTETLVSPRVADALASSANVRTAVLNPLEGLTAAQLKAGQDYVSVMNANLATLRTALGCS